MNCVIRVGLDLFRSVSVLGCGNSLIGGGGSSVWQFIVENYSYKHLDFGESSRLIL